MKIFQLHEATYSGGRTRDPGYYVMDSSEPDDIKFIGPFAVGEDVNKYIKYMDEKYGKDVPIVLEPGSVVSPEAYEEDIAAFHKWMTESEV